MTILNSSVKEIIQFHRNNHPKDLIEIGQDLKVLSLLFRQEYTVTEIWDACLDIPKKYRPFLAQLFQALEADKTE